MKWLKLLIFIALFWRNRAQSSHLDRWGPSLASVLGWSAGDVFTVDLYIKDGECKSVTSTLKLFEFVYWIPFIICGVLLCFFKSMSDILICVLYLRLKSSGLNYDISYYSYYYHHHYLTRFSVIGLQRSLNDHFSHDTFFLQLFCFNLLWSKPVIAL